MINIIKLIWLIIPAGVANMVPPLAAKLWPKWTTPIDGGKSIRGTRIFGDHKTVRGLVTGIVTAQIVYWLMPKYLQNLPWYFGGLLGLAALSADAIKSFFKRRAGIKSGQSWFLWDQIDWIVGLVIVSVNILNFEEVVVLLGVGLVLHLIIKCVGYALKINKTFI